ncbi:hypothetical protein BDA96_08G019500 [Sorghum bicolor]|uniref:Uncharacterized protein n=2 Tax=Sorghum bicolor TaxID=4558 RepID=A0A921U6Q0_SORBI|nr:hypothetical protein BDA96_08G019500 [Sorghum bicolor]OQU78643.1 hypothetical protein SORBI_3008G017850 [Sorghum bicolor]
MLSCLLIAPSELSDSLKVLRQYFNYRKQFSFRLLLLHEPPKVKIVVSIVFPCLAVHFSSLLVQIMYATEILHSTVRSSVFILCFVWGLCSCELWGCVVVNNFQTIRMELCNDG